MKDAVLDKEVGARVRALRKARRMSLMEVGARLGVTYQQVQKYEKGLNQMSAVTVAEIARIFETTPDHLLGFDGAADEILQIRDRLGVLAEPTRANLIAGIKSMIASVEAVGAAQT